MLSPTFFLSHEGRVDSGLDSCDSRRIGLGLSPDGDVRVPLKVQARLMRLEADASDPGFGLILGDFFHAQGQEGRAVASFE
jgi:hypothetical protein